MARFAITSAVYLGDVAPYIPIGRTLVERGHEVTFVTAEGFRSLLEPEPFRFHPYALDSSPAAMNRDPEHTRLMRHPNRNAMQLGRYWMNRTFTDDVDGCVESLRAAFDGTDAVITHPTFGVASIPVARSMGIPTLVGHLFPMMVPTREWGPPMGPRSPDLGGPMNRFAWWALTRLSGIAFRDRALNDMRRRLGFDPIRGHAMRAWQEADRVVLLTSEHYWGPSAADWPPMTWGGFSIWQGPEGRQLPPDLDEYVGAGDPPVVVTLGTSAATDAGQQFARIAGDLDAAGLRSVLLVGHETNLEPVEGHPAAVPFAPLAELLPRCSVAVVSGALGGVAAALTAGVPLVVHPQLFDQVWHGARVEELGVGLLARKAEHVGPAVARIAADPGFAARARSLAQRLTDEDGARVAADAAEALVA